MKTQSNKYLETETDQQPTGKKSLFVGGIVVFLIALCPIIFYSYKGVPEVKVWDTFLFSGETAFYSWFDFAWYFVGKFVPLYLLMLWFFTCKHWWHWIILIPIAMYSFQLYGIIQENEGIDEVELIYVLPLMMVIVPSVYLIRAKLFNSVHGNDLKEFEEELGKKQSFFGQIKDLFR